MINKNVESQPVVWQPFDGLVSNIYVESVFEGGGKLEIKVKLENSVNHFLNITFDYPMAYRRADDNCVTEYLLQLNPRDNSLYISDSSPFIDWFRCNSGEIYDDIKFYHYVICGLDMTFEVISVDPPLIKD